MAAATGDSDVDSADDDDDNDFELVYRAVAAGDTVEQVQRAIEACARGSARRRATTVSQAGAYKAAEKGSVPHDETPLAAACRLRRSDLVALLVEAGADVRVDGDLSPLALCISCGDVDTVRALLRAGVDANAELSYKPYKQHGRSSSWSYLSYSSSYSVRCTAAHLCLWPPQVPLADRDAGPPQLEILEILAREGKLDVNARDGRGLTPLFWVPKMVSGHEAAVDLLVSLGADVNARSEFGSGPSDTPLIALVQCTPTTYLVPCARKLVAAGARALGVFGAKGLSPLATAAQHTNSEAVRFLLEEAGAPADERDPVSGRTALHEAGQKPGDPVPICAKLLDAGADVNAVDNQGRTPIFACASPGKSSSNSWDNPWGSSWRSPRAHGRFGNFLGNPQLQPQQSISVLRLLIARGASVDVTDCNGETPLLTMCSDLYSLRDRRHAVKAILRRSSAQTRCAVDQDGSSAVDCVIDYARTHSYALKPWHHQLIAELLSSGASVQARNAARVLPIAVSHGLPLAARNEAELAVRRSEGRRWCAHKDVAGLAQDAREMREAEQVVAAKRQRLEELEGEFGGSSATDSGDDDDDDEEEDDKEEEDDEEEEGGAGDDDEGGKSGGDDVGGSELGSDEDGTGAEGDGQAGCGDDGKGDERAGGGGERERESEEGGVGGGQ